MNTLSWRSPTTPLPTENNPRVVFERLFGDGGTSAQRLAQARENRSILDSVTAELARLLEHARPERSHHGERLPRCRCAKSSGGFRASRSTARRPCCRRWNGRLGIPERFDEHVKLMFDLQWLAFQADITRVVTFMLGRELNFRTYPEIGITEGHHGLSHHGDNPEQLAKYAKLNTYQAQLFA